MQSDKKDFGKTAPQGSLLSPIFWRIYDAIFVELYKINLAHFMNKNEDILLITHVSYADDQLTIITFIIEIEASDFQVANRMSKILDTTRKLFQDATVEIGCGINPLKSENIVSEKFSELVDLNFENDTENNPAIYRRKSSFKWLGYWLVLKRDHRLDFDEGKIQQQLNMVTNFRNEVYQYTSNRWIKYRIFKVFIAPFIELGLPLVIQNSFTKITAVHTLQHRSFCFAVGAIPTCSREHLEEILGERSVIEKARRFATRMTQSLHLKLEVDGTSSDRLLRSSKTVAFSYRKSDQCFISRVLYYSLLPEQNFKTVKFNISNISAKVARINRKISTHIKEKELSTQGS